MVALKFGRSIWQDQVSGFVKDQVLKVRGGIFECLDFGRESFKFDAPDYHSIEDPGLSVRGDLSLKHYNRSAINESCDRRYKREVPLNTVLPCPFFG